jgi:hypothetical protein
MFTTKTTAQTFSPPRKGERLQPEFALPEWPEVRDGLEGIPVRYTLQLHYPPPIP